MALFRFFIQIMSTFQGALLRSWNANKTLYLTKVETIYTISFRAKR